MWRETGTKRHRIIDVLGFISFLVITYAKK